MHDLYEELERARADRLATAQAVALATGNSQLTTELTNADNAAQAKVHELELKIRTEEEAEQFRPAQ